MKDDKTPKMTNIYTKAYPQQSLSNSIKSEINRLEKRIEILEGTDGEQKETKGKVIKHKRRIVDISAPMACDLWLFLQVTLSNFTWNDRQEIEDAFKSKSEEMYGDKFTFSLNFNSARKMAEGNPSETSRKMIAKLVKDIENPTRVYIK